MKKICLLLLLATFSALSPSANAQLGIYGEFSATHVPGDAFLGTTSAWYSGSTFGAYDDFLHAGPIGLGFDLRGNFAKANGLGEYAVLAGPRIAVQPPLLPLRPYLQAAVGLGGVNSSGLSTRYTGRLEYGLVGGLDYTLIHSIDLRVAEVGYLRTTANQFSGPAAGVNLVTVGAGIVFRIP